MKRNIQASAILLLMGTLLYSCDTTNPPFTDDLVKSDLSPASTTFVADDYPTLTLHENIIKLVDVVTGENDDGVTTTFKYSVTNTGTTPVANKFTLELLECLGDPVSFSPELGENDDDFLSADIITWGRAIPSPSSREYSITYAGTIATGLITAGLTRQGTSVEGSIAGPACAEAANITISGVLFIDANENGSKDPEEAGLENIEVILSDNDGNFVASTLTEDLGVYSFEVSESSGSFRITVPEELVDFKYYKIFNYAVSAERPSSTTYVLADTDTNQENINFGYVLDTEELTSDLLDGTVLTNTKSSQYWAFQVRHAAINRAQVERNPNVHFTIAELIEILEEIEEFYLEIPFQFSNNGELKLQEALSILTSPFNNDYDELLQQLLTAQFNVLSKERGALIEYNETGEPILNDPFNTAILIFGEAVACNAMGACPGGVESSVAKSKVISTTTSFSSATISDGTRVLSAFNGTGGIGSR